MRVTWKELAFLPSAEALCSLREAWSWLLPEAFELVTASVLGDVFFQQGTPEIYWLNTGTGDITKVADSRAEFMELLRTDKADEWFMPHLVEDLRAAEKLLKDDYCYTMWPLPIFSEGRYEVPNLNPVPAAQRFRVSGEVHRQIRDLPDGSKAEIRWV